MQTSYIIRGRMVLLHYGWPYYEPQQHNVDKTYDNSKLITMWKFILVLIKEGIYCLELFDELKHWNLENIH